MPLTSLTQDEIIHILGGLRLLISLHKTNLRGQEYVDQSLIDTIQECQELFDQFWRLLDSVSESRLSAIWYPSAN